MSSPHLRCLQTIAPLAAHVGLEVERAPALAPDAPVAALSLIRGLSASQSPSGVVLRTHGEVMGAVLTEMVAERWS